MDEKAARSIAVRSRLRRELRTARAAVGWTQRQVADELGWSVTKLMRIESGQVGISTTDLRALLTVYGITDSEHVAALVELSKETRHEEWGPYRDVLHSEYRTYLGYEGLARRLRQFEPLVVPGMLQTSRYARALIESVAKPGTSDDVIDRQVEVRVRRQALLHRGNPPEMRFIIDEGALRRWVGSPGDREIWVEQLERLKKLGGLPSVGIQILSLTYGSHVGLTGAFVILEFDEPDPAVLYQENGRPNLLTRDNPRQVETYRELFETLQRDATDPDKLASVIDDIVS